MRPKPLLIFATFALILAACSGAAGSDVEEANPTKSPTETPVEKVPEVDNAATESNEDDPATILLQAIQPVDQIDLDKVPAVDTSLYSVPLEEIIFDTFRSVNRAVPLPNAQPALIRSLRGRDPTFV